jgi:hypothetical protein
MTLKLWGAWGGCGIPGALLNPACNLRCREHSSPAALPPGNSCCCSNNSSALAALPSVSWHAHAQACPRQYQACTHMLTGEACWCTSARGLVHRTPSWYTVYVNPCGWCGTHSALVFDAHARTHASGLMVDTCYAHRRSRRRWDRWLCGAVCRQAHPRCQQKLTQCLLPHTETKLDAEQRGVDGDQGMAALAMCQPACAVAMWLGPKPQPPNHKHGP